MLPDTRKMQWSICPGERPSRTFCNPQVLLSVVPVSRQVFVQQKSTWINETCKDCKGFNQGIQLRLKNLKHQQSAQNLDILRQVCKGGVQPQNLKHCCLPCSKWPTLAFLTYSTELGVQAKIRYCMPWPVINIYLFFRSLCMSDWYDMMHMISWR